MCVINENLESRMAQIYSLLFLWHVFRVRIIIEICSTVPRMGVPMLSLAVGISVS